MSSNGLEGDLESFARADDTKRALQKALRDLATAKAKKADLIAAIYEAAKAAALAQPDPTPIKPPKKGRPGDHWLLLHLTDWQFGKETASYNREVAERRVVKAVEKALRLTELQRNAYPVSSCALLLGGDMIEGTSIFPAQSWQVDASLFDQLFGVSGVIERVVRALLQHFGTVKVWEEYGNHGRIGKFGEQPAGDNVDRIAYRIARERIGKQASLEWTGSEQFYQRGQIGNYSFLLVHGDEIKSFGGNIPAYGIKRKCTSWASGVVEPFQDVYMGHFHIRDCYQLPNGGMVYLTGSTESGNEYAREVMAATGRPHQRAHFIDPARGRVTDECALYLDDVA